MKRFTFSLVLVGLLALGAPAFSELCTVDAVPAATLLVPYFEVDPDGGLTTLFSIHNASAAPTIAHVIFWTDWSFPTIDFDIYLTGYDVATVNVRDVFNGNVPLTADPPNDPFQANATCGIADPTVASSPCGGANSINRHWDDSNPALAGAQGFPFCQNIFPNFDNPVITGTALSRLQNGHSGLVVPSINNCVGDNHGDGHFRGYITIDNASQCSLVLDPGFPGYFVDGGLGIANNINQLWGDYFLVDVVNNFAQGDTLVHVEANDLLDAVDIPLLDPNTGVPVTTVPNATGYTFYGRYFQPQTGPDNREPLGTIWGTRYINGGAFTGGTQLLVWRDSTSDDIAPPPNQSWCNGNGPGWFPLNETEVIAFNESEDAVEICFFTGGFVSPPDESDPPCFPYETGRYQWGEGDLSVPFEFGWAYLNLNLPPDGFPPVIGDADFGPDGNIAQSHVTTLHSASGLFSVGLQAVQLFDACQDFNEFLNGAFQNGGTNIINN